MEPTGFEEHRHTADWALRVWAPDMAGLLEQAARGMYLLMGVERRDEPRAERELEISAPDPESLLVSFLSELLFILEQEYLVFDSFDIEAGTSHVSARLGGAPCSAIAKEIKAVTYHKLNVQETAKGLEVTIVFDV